MEFKGEILSHLLRIITPRIIAELSTSSQGKKKVPLSSLIETYCDKGHYEGEPEDEEDETKAKILSFDQGEDPISQEEESELLENEVEKEKIIFKCMSRVNALLSDYVKKCHQMDKNVLGAKRPPKRELRNNVISIEDILDQKKKFEKSYGLIKSKEVLDLYQTTSKNNISKAIQKDQECDEFGDSERGILINKKQA